MAVLQASSLTETTRIPRQFPGPAISSAYGQNSHPLLTTPRILTDWPTHTCACTHTLTHTKNTMLHAWPWLYSRHEGTHAPRAQTRRQEQSFCQALSSSSNKPEGPQDLCTGRGRMEITRQFHFPQVETLRYSEKQRGRTAPSVCWAPWTPSPALCKAPPAGCRPRRTSKPHLDVPRKNGRVKHASLSRVHRTKSNWPWGPPCSLPLMVGASERTTSRQTISIPEPSKERGTVGRSAGAAAQQGAHARRHGVCSTLLPLPHSPRKQ